MTKSRTKTPVVLIVYKRLDHLAGIIASLRQYQPDRLYLVSDGAKTAQEKTQVDAVRKYLEGEIDWPCQVVKIYAKDNLGLKQRVVTGLNQVFSVESQAIILEDDLVIDPSFFHFCEELLTKYQNDPHIISISGNNFQFDKYTPSVSYYFSQYIHSWGWATWARAWQVYQDELVGLDELGRSHGLKKLFGSTILEWYWLTIFHLVRQNKFDTWAYRFSYAAFRNNLLTIIPSVNLVSNFGFGRGATHTRLKHRSMGLPTHTLSFPLAHPAKVVVNKAADRNTSRHLYLTLRGILGLLYKKYLT